MSNTDPATTKTKEIASVDEKKEPWAMLIPSDDKLPHISLVEAECTIGRSNRCSFRIHDSHISGVHVKIKLKEIQGLTLIGLVDHSSNGTYLNQSKIEKGKTYYVKHMDIISLVHPRSKKWTFSFLDLSFAKRGEHSEIEGKYQLFENIGEGTFSVVKRGLCIATGEPVAVKVIDKSRFFHIAKTREQISREVAILKQIQHPNIISIHDVIETDSWLYIILEMAQGGDLFRSLEVRSQFSEKDAKRIFTQILQALQYLHNDKNTAHRDLKPENILLADKSPTSPIKITDFGLARMVSSTDVMTTMCGTPEYVAPEILFSSKKEQALGYGLEVDMWSAGVLLYILLSGRLAFQQADKHLLYQSIRNGEFTFSPESRWKHVSEAAKNLISKLIEVNPKTRYTVDQALADDWIQNETKKVIPLGIHKEISQTLSQECVSFNVLEYLELPESKETFDDVPPTPTPEQASPPSSLPLIDVDSLGKRPREEKEEQIAKVMKTNENSDAASIIHSREKEEEISVKE